MTVWNHNVSGGRVIAKLTTIDNHPMNRVLGFGTKYLKENFSPWIQQHGGWVSEFYLKMKSSQNSGGTAWKGVFSWVKEK